MFYAMSSRRKIDKYYQLVSTYQSGFIKISASQAINVLKAVHSAIRTAVEAFNGTHSSGELTWLDIITHPDFENTKQFDQSNLVAKLIVTFVRPDDPNGKAITVMTEEVSFATVGSAIATAFASATGLDLSAIDVQNSTYIVNTVAFINERRATTNG